jgi:hypothetical protein
MHCAAFGFLVPFIFILLMQPFGKDGAEAILSQVLQFGVVGLTSAIVLWWFAEGLPSAPEHEQFDCSATYIWPTAVIRVLE